MNAYTEAEMSFVIATDTSANLPTPYTKEHGLVVIPLSYRVFGEEHFCMDTEEFNAKEADAYFAAMKKGERVTTSQVPPQRYIDALTPVLEAGNDVLFVGMSSGISGSYASSEIAAAQLRETFPERTIRTVDTLGASMGEGIPVMHAVEWRGEGLGINEIADRLLDERACMYQGVLLDDLMYLSRGGRLSGAKAVIGTVLGIRPLLKGNDRGELVVCGKTRGRKAALAALAERYAKLVTDAAKRIVSVVYTDCKQDAEELAEMICKIAQPRKMMVLRYEPVTGSYLGPGAVALFFEGGKDVREA